REFADFVLRLECRMTKNSDSGVVFRAGTGDDMVRSGLEVQLIDDDAWNLKLDERNSSLVGVTSRSKVASKPVGEWNSYEIIAQGRRIRVVLNGTVVLDADLADHVQKAEQRPGISRRQG